MAAAVPDAPVISWDEFLALEWPHEWVAGCRGLCGGNRSGVLAGSRGDLRTAVRSTGQSGAVSPARIEGELTVVLAPFCALRRQVAAVVLRDEHIDSGDDEEGEQGADGHAADQHD